MMKVQDSETLSRQMLQALNAQHYSEHCSTSVAILKTKVLRTPLNHTCWLKASL